MLEEVLLHRKPKTLRVRALPISSRTNVLTPLQGVPEGVAGVMADRKSLRFHRQKGHVFPDLMHLHG